MRQLLQQHRPIHGTHAVIILVAQRRVVVIVLVLDLHERNRLLELFERVLQHGCVVEALDEFGQKLDVFGDGADAVGVDRLHVGSEGKDLESVRLALPEGGRLGSEGKRRLTRIRWAAWLRASK